MKKYLILFLLLAFMSIQSDEVFTQSQLKDIRSSAEQAAIDGTSKIVWLTAGCLLNGLGIAGAFVFEPNPPAAQLVGKDYNYVRVYTDYFVKKAQKIQVKYAIWGCVGSTGATLILYGAYVYWYIDMIKDISDVTY